MFSGVLLFFWDCKILLEIDPQAVSLYVEC